MAEKQGFVKEITTGLPAWAKGVIAVGVIGGVGYAIYRIAKKGGNILKPIDTKKDAKKLEEQGQIPTYLSSNYKQFADALYAARSANATLFWGGTNEKAMYNIFSKMKNDLDIVKLIEAFGERRLSYSLQYANLGGFLADELNDDEIAIINKDLKSRKINYQF
jgi:hypothetical protein